MNRTEQKRIERIREKCFNNQDKANESVNVYLIMKNGETHGKIIARWTSPRTGSVCHTSLMMYRMDYDREPIAWFKEAGGYGYDKFAQTMKIIMRENRDALEAYGCRYTEADGVEIDLFNRWQNVFEHGGYTVLQAL